MSRPSFLRRYAVWILALAFVLAYAQLPLFSWDQNTYFLHGLTAAGYGNLGHDWLAHTADPVPVFSALVAFTHRIGADWLFHVYYDVLLVIYFLALLDIGGTTFGFRWNGRHSLALGALIVLIHATATRFAVTHIAGVDAISPFVNGVASQGLLGPIFQPSVFAVFLVVSIALYLRGWNIAAAAAAVFGATVHPTYVLDAGILVVTYMVLTALREHRLRRAALTGGIALLLVLPIVWYVARSFGPTSADISHEALSILVHFRIPHHTQPTVWFGSSTVVRLFIVLAALIAVVRKPLFGVLAGAFGAVLVLTAAQVATSSLHLAILMPWRLSTVIMPISTTCLLGTGVTWLAERHGEAFERHAPRWYTAAGAVLIALAIAGIASTVRKLDVRRDEPETPMVRFVRSDLAHGQKYLIPPRMQDFRLRTGAPIFVDFKSHPYRDVQVLTWYRHYREATKFYADSGMTCDAADTFLVENSITDVVAPTGWNMPCAVLARIYRDDHYTVYRVVQPAR